MKYHGEKARYAKRYFEGWYLKHKIGERVFAVIPGIASDAEGKREAFIQLIDNDASHFFRFDAGDFRADARRFDVRIGKNRFQESGVYLDIDQAQHSVQADIRYAPFLPLTKSLYMPDLMGPFSYLHFLECYHDVLSLRHGLHGEYTVDGANHTLEGGSGYIEKDWGRSFPESWVWFECHAFEGAPDATLVFAAARIPFLGLRFTGVLCVGCVDGEQHRLATYLGARIISQAEKEGEYSVELRQHGHTLRLRVKLENGGALRAPVLGSLTREILEYPACEARVTWTKNGKTILDAQGHCAGFEKT